MIYTQESPTIDFVGHFFVYRQSPQGMVPMVFPAR